MMSQCHFLMHACPATPTFTDSFITIRVQVGMLRIMLVMILALASSRDLHRNGQQVIVVSSYNSFQLWVNRPWLNHVHLSAALAIHMNCSLLD